jgi:ABC-2 type transport system permease protein
MRTKGLFLHQFRCERKRFFRDPAEVFFALAFPLVFLFVFAAVLGSGKESGHVGGHLLSDNYYYLPAVLTVFLVQANFVNLSISLTASRERGVLKRARGTPLPLWVFMAARTATMLAVSVGLVVLTALVGRAFYHVALPTTTLPALVLTLVLGSASLSALGFVLSAATRSEGAAAALSSLIALPLYFVSGLFAHNDMMPASVRHLGEVFPVNRIFTALAIAFDPKTTGSGLRGWDLAVVCMWGVAGLVLACRFFRWSPRSG